VLKRGFACLFAVSIACAEVADARVEQTGVHHHHVASRMEPADAPVSIFARDRSQLRSKEFTASGTETVDAEDCRANRGTRPAEDGLWKVRINQPVEVVNQEALVGRRCAGSDLEPLLG